MNKLSKEKRARVIACLVEGCSIRATVRLTGVHMTTILNLLRDVGEVCRDYQDRAFRNLPCRRLQVDELWSYCYAKQRNVPNAKAAPKGAGDVWTWVAIDADTKLVPSWLVGRRDSICASEFISDLAGRLANRIQLTTDGHKPYLMAVEDAFGSEIDYAQLVKLYGTPQEEHRYSPPQCIGIRMFISHGDPDPGHISTSYVERQNLTVRMQNRRFTRLTNAFSKKLENHAASVALHYMHYNFCRVHKTLRVTPAMEAGVSDHVWTIEEMVGLLESKEAERAA